MTARSITALVLASAVGGAAWVSSLNAVQAAQETPKPPPQAAGATLQVKDISTEQAQTLITAAMEKARSTDTKMNIAVVDAGGNLKAFARMDGAWLGSIDISIKKAKTARYFDMPTGDLGKASQPGGPLYGIEVTNQGLVSFPGGELVKAADGTIVGAIGVSGSTVEKDAAVAQAGAAAFK